MLINLTFLRTHRDYRYLFLGQLISAVGSMMTYIALPYQMYELTQSSFSVGMISIAELCPLLITAFLGGAYADRFDRRKLLIRSELALAASTGLLAWYTWATTPSQWVLYIAAATISAINGFHRPALEAMTQQLGKPEDYAHISALNSLKSILGSVGGPSLAGFCIATFGLPAAYLIDGVSFALSLLAILQIKQIAFVTPEAATSASPLTDIQEGLRYAWGRQELLGSYAVDFCAMIFGMPTALFPAVADMFADASLTSAQAVGYLYSAPAVGALVATLLSGWTHRIRSFGKAISISALIWGVCIIGFGCAHSFWLAVLFLALAGGADAMSGIFRMTLWNTTIPKNLRGRMAGIEMMSYMSGPMLGNAESGLVAAAFGTRFSIVSGGAMCLLGVSLCAIALPRYWNFKSMEA